MTKRREAMAAVAATRFGLGARPGELDRLRADPVGALLAQIEPSAAPAWPGARHSRELIADWFRLNRVEPDPGARTWWKVDQGHAEFLRRVVHASTTTAPFRERWTTFWMNNFALRTSEDVILLAGAFVREVIEPHLFGRFEDMAVASTKHPAMLISLEQVSSIGPNSEVGRATGRGLNENLARELMELHTLGADAGYTQGDVTEMARALAGWRVGDDAVPPALRHAFYDDPTWREPGARRLLGRNWPEAEGRAEAMVRALAREPATARNLAFKLARHFEADDPSPSLVERLRVALADGDLRGAAEALITAPEMWREEQRKFKTPYEFLVSVHRAAGTEPEDGAALSGRLERMGQHPMWSRTAEGWTDTAEAWATPYGIGQRADYAWAHGGKSGAIDSRAFAQDVLGPLVRTATSGVVASVAHDRAGAFAMVLMSPEFQRR